MTMTIVKELDKYGWKLKEFGYDMGIVCFAHDLDEEAKVVFKRAYDGGEWDKNIWDITIKLSEIVGDLCHIEMFLFYKMQEFLISCNLPYTKEDAITDEWLDKRAALEEMYVEWR